MVMRRRLGLLGGTTSLLVAAAVVTAAPAEARNIGGTVPEGSVCVYPGNSAHRSDQAASVVPCMCVVVPGVGTQRNVGGTTPAGGSCPPGLTTIPREG
jgi:hypothetical protein